LPRSMRRPQILPKLTPERQARFWARGAKRGPDDCWLWTGGRSSDGYGLAITAPFTRLGAHRIAWALHWGREPGEGFVCHSCDTPLCCNPAHLFLGDAKINAQDKVNKGRARGRFSGVNTPLTAGLPQQGVQDVR